MARQIVEFKILAESKDILKDLIKDFRKEIIEKGLDEPLASSIETLKVDLRFIINEKVGVNPGSPPGIDDKNTNGLGQSTINPPKSDQEVLNYLTNGKTDLSKYNKAKDFTTLSETGVVFGHRSRGQDSNNRVALRLDIEDGDTVQSQYAKARTFFQESIFALPDASGNMNYYANPGLDITSFLKIKCSTLTGDGDAEPFTGMSPAQRFQRNRHTKGYADWTLRQNGVNFIRNNFINLTPTMNLIKEGDFETARKVLNKTDKSNKLPGIKAQSTNLAAENPTKNETLKNSIGSYINVISLINSIKLSKKVSPEAVTYSLVADYDDFSSEDSSVFKQVTAGLRIWVVQFETIWFNKLINKVSKLLKKYTT